jgi:protein TonB
MFEQSLLAQHGGVQKTGALFASLTAQILAGGVLLLIPLAYNEGLPVLRLSYPLPVPAMRLLPAPEVKSAAVDRHSQRPALTYRNVFRLPESNPRPSPGSAPVIELDSSAIPPGPAAPGFELATVTAAPIPFLSLESPPQAATAPVPPPGPITVGGDVQSAKIIHKVLPFYPPLARQARVQGTVHLVGIIAKDGTVQKLRVESGHPLLVQYAVDAVRQWVYRPTLLNGVPVEVIAPIDVIFTLQ